MNHAHCHDLLSSLSEYVDGSLDDSLCAEIERHMAGCENCRIVIDTLRKTIELYQVTAIQPHVPQDVQSRLFHRLELDEFLGNPSDL
jgi:anti-sigma factor (TIGR02949 family)